MIDEKEILIPTNEFQTEITQELLNNYPEEIQEWFMDAVTNIPFIKNLISPNRRRAKDMPKDENGRIIIDFENPHIIEDADYFRPAALFYMQHGCYTLLKPNSNPQSEYKKFWTEERRRIREGYVRESDGEWVTGFCYWFLNYTPMMVNVIREGTDTADRIESFPFFFEGIYWRFHYLYQAKLTGKHAIELAKRGCAKSYSLASIMTHNLFHGESEIAKKRITTVLTAYEKEYLKDEKDGTFAKFTPMMDFVRTNTPFPRLMLKNSPNDMSWQMGYKDATGATAGNRNTVLGVSAKDNPDKLRGKRGWILFEEMGCHIKGTEVLMYNKTFKKVEDVKVGDLLMGKDGTYRVVEECFNGTDDMYKVTLSNGDWHIVNSIHPIYYKKRKWYNNIISEELSTAPELIGKNLNGCYIPKANISYPYKEVYLDPYLLGLWLGDGDSNLFSIANEDKEVLGWLSRNYNGHLVDLKQSENCKVFYVSTKDVSYVNFRYYNLFGNKHIPSEYIYNSPEIGLQVLAGLIDTDGNYSEKAHSRCFEITQRYDRKNILDAAKAIATNLGFRCTMSKRTGQGLKKGVVHYRLKISGNIENIPTKIKRKQARPLERKYKSRNDWNDYTFKVEYYGKNEYYGFTVSDDHLFVLKDLTITHNTFKGLLPLYDTTRKSVEEGNYAFACMYLVGTSNEKESSFESAKILLYHTQGYRIYTIKNVFDKVGTGRDTFGFFFPAYINRAGCYNKDGVSDVVKALFEIFQARYTAKYGTDPNSLLRTIAEDPITPAEAIIKVKDAFFPVTALNERLMQIESNPSFFDDVYIGNLVFNTSTNKVEYRVSDDIPIRKYGVENTTPGAIEFYEMPILNSEGKVPYDRYIIGHDPVDNDQAESSSLTSTFVFDLWTDRIVAEYTGRQNFADSNFEIVRLLCLFYNAKCLFESNKKGIFSYFQRMNSTHLLAETPDYLRERQLVKYSNFGSNRYGVNANAAINNFANGLIRDWLLKEVTMYKKDEHGEDMEVTMPMLYTLKNKALIEELVAFNPINNFDRIRALGMVMLYREEKMILYGNNIGERKDEYDASYMGNDDYFKKNYDDRAESPLWSKNKNRRVY